MKKNRNNNQHHKYYQTQKTFYQWINGSKFVKSTEKNIPFYLEQKTGKKILLILTACVHGKEIIGEKIIAHMIKDILAIKNIDIICVPFVNPHGVKNNQRSNENGVDLMRNSSLQQINAISQLLLVLGQRFSNKLPYFMWKKGKLEIQNQRREKIIKENQQKYKKILNLDLHSWIGKDSIRMAANTTAQREQEILEKVNKTLTKKWLKTIPKQPYKSNGDMMDYLSQTYWSQNQKDSYFLWISYEMWFREMLWKQMKRPRGFIKFIKEFPNNIFSPPKETEQRFIKQESKIILETLKTAINHLKKE